VWFSRLCFRTFGAIPNTSCFSLLSACNQFSTGREPICHLAYISQLFQGFHLVVIPRAWDSCHSHWGSKVPVVPTSPAIREAWHACRDHCVQPQPTITAPSHRSHLLFRFRFSSSSRIASIAMASCKYTLHLTSPCTVPSTVTRRRHRSHQSCRVSDRHSYASAPLTSQLRLGRKEHGAQQLPQRQST
jgi:hypothetical protein